MLRFTYVSTSKKSCATLRLRACVLIFLLPLVATQAANSQSLATLVNFNSSDGSYPLDTLALGSDGNFYGTTEQGGVGQAGCPRNAECGTVFKMTAEGVLTTLYSFCSQSNCSDGYFPVAGLVQGADGNFYGTTSFGGNGADRGNYAAGTIFKVSPLGVFTTVYNFCSLPNCLDGAGPEAGLIQGTDGNFYSTTSFGGKIGFCPGGRSTGCGTVFRISPSGTLTTLHNFCSQSDCADGDGPSAGLIQGTDGDFYGTAASGGFNNNGTIFKVSSKGAFSILYSFCSQLNCADGSQPIAGLIQASDGNLYGTTADGGANGAGTVFKLTPSGTFTTLYNFCSQSNCSDGSTTTAGLTQGKDGNLYGTTYEGGLYYSGTLFRITLNGALTTLYNFCREGGILCLDGTVPQGGMIQAHDGTFYGMTSGGGLSGNGTVFRLLPAPFLTFPWLGNGSTPNTPYNAPIFSVFDHTMQNASEQYKTYTCDNVVTAYTSETGLKTWGSNAATCTGHPGYAQDSEYTPFFVNGNYLGSGNGVGGSEGKPPEDFLNYDGHTGIDYGATYGSAVVAATSGIVHYPTYRSLVVSKESVGGNPDEYNVLELDPTNAPGYKLFYLHLSTHPRTISLYLKGNVTGQDFLATQGIAVQPMAPINCTKTPPVGSFSIQGQVTLNGVGLPNVGVVLIGNGVLPSGALESINPTSTHTDSQGNYAFELLPTGYYHLEAALSGYTFAAAEPNVIVQEGQSVAAGEEIALSGNSGNCIGPHLHFEVQEATNPVQQQATGYSYIPVDPYGWDGENADPYSSVSGGMQNFLLWIYSPTVSGIAPVTASAGALFDLTISGTGFDSGAVDCLVLQGGSYSACLQGIVQSRSGNQLVIQETLTSGTYFVRVQNSDGNRSNWRQLTVQ
jgi:uncharacterized repeat protein (TIGR03803 family)